MTLLRPKTRRVALAPRVCSTPAPEISAKLVSQRRQHLRRDLASAPHPGPPESTPLSPRAPPLCHVFTSGLLSACCPSDSRCGIDSPGTTAVYAVASDDVAHQIPEAAYLRFRVSEAGSVSLSFWLSSTVIAPPKPIGPWKENTTRAVESLPISLGPVNMFCPRWRPSGAR